MACFRASFVLQPVLVRIRGLRAEEDEERTHGACMPPDSKVCVWDIAWARQIWSGKGARAKIGLYRNPVFRR